jgi:hypothetical protein
LKDPVQAAILKNCKIADNKANADDKRVSDITYHDFVKLVNSEEDTSKIISDKSPRRMLASEFREERGGGRVRTCCLHLLAIIARKKVDSLSSKMPSGCSHPSCFSTGLAVFCFGE